MSHEILTPIHGILGFATLLKDQDHQPPQQTHWLDLLIASADVWGWNEMASYRDAISQFLRYIAIYFF